MWLQKGDGAGSLRIMYCTWRGMDALYAGPGNGEEQRKKKKAWRVFLVLVSSSVEFATRFIPPNRYPFLSSD